MSLFSPKSPLSAFRSAVVVLVIVLLLLIVALAYYAAGWLSEHGNEFPRVADAVNFVVTALVVYLNWGSV